MAYAPFSHPLFFLTVASLSLFLLYAPIVCGKEKQNEFVSVSATRSLRPQSSEASTVVDDCSNTTVPAPTTGANGNEVGNTPVQYRRTRRLGSLKTYKNVCCSQCYRKDMVCLKYCQSCSHGYSQHRGKHFLKGGVFMAPKKYKHNYYTKSSQYNNYYGGGKLSTLLPAAASITATLGHFLPFTGAISSGISSINSLINVATTPWYPSQPTYPSYNSHQQYSSYYSGSPNNGPTQYYPSKTMRSCERDVDLVYAEFCKKKCASSRGQQTSKGYFKIPSSCRDQCRSGVQTLCTKNSCQEYGCYVPECYDWAPAKCV